MGFPVKTALPPMTKWEAIRKWLIPYLTLAVQRYRYRIISFEYLHYTTNHQCFSCQVVNPSSHKKPSNVPV